MKNPREQPVIVVRRRKRKHGGHHGGAWKVALADFMTSMMALFLVLWLVTQSSEVRSSIAGYFQDPLGRGNEFGTSVIPGDGQPLMPTRPRVELPPTDAGRQQLMELSQRLRTVADSHATAARASHLLFEMTDHGLRISLLEDSTDVFFASGSATPLPVAVPLFRAMGAILGATPVTVEIEGHTDAVPYRGGREYGNWELSADRANSVRRLLVGGGLDESAVAAVRGLAERVPLDPERPTAHRNRRVTILVEWRTAASAGPEQRASIPVAAPVT